MSKRVQPVSAQEDLVHLLTSVNKRMMAELGKSGSQKKPSGRKAARCPACHNRALSDRKDPPAP